MFHLLLLYLNAIQSSPLEIFAIFNHCKEGPKEARVPIGTHSGDARRASRLSLQAPPLTPYLSPLSWSLLSFPPGCATTAVAAARAAAIVAAALVVAE